MVTEIEQLLDGIYFGLDDDTYHGQERLSASGVCNMLVSPATFWKESWLNPDREPRNTKALAIGRAYDKAKFEPEAFLSGYAPLPNPADYGDELLTTHAKIQEKLADLGEKKTLAGEKVLEAAVRLRGAGYTGPIWHLIDAEAAEKREADGTIGIDPSTYREIVNDMKMLRANPEISPMFEGGEAQVSVLWTDEKGVKWKARFDYLKERIIVDLKSFENGQRKNLNQCISDAIRFNRLHVQGFLYRDVAEMIRTGKLRIAKVQNQGQKDLIAAIRASDVPFEFWWLFQEKRGVPNVLARRFRMTRQPTPELLYNAPNEEARERLRQAYKSFNKLALKAKWEIEWARDTYLKCLEIWPDGPWGSLQPVMDIDDEDFPPYFLEDV